MPRSMWRGAISFGMVAIPVRMYLATESKNVSFRLLCPSCHHAIKNKRWCPNEEKEVGWNEVLRGFEVSKGDYVIVDDSELDRLPLKSTHTIDILEFCADQEIDAGVYIKGAYYLEPEAVGAKPYSLLRAALGQTGKVAIGKIALRDREHLCRIALHGNGIILNTLHWPDEIRSTGELSIPESAVDSELQKRELEMATMLIDNLTAQFDPARYRDEYRDAVLALVEAKIHQEPIQEIEPAEPAKVTDLMAALKASVEASKTRQATAGSDADGAQSEERRKAEPAARRRKAS